MDIELLNYTCIIKPQGNYLTSSQIQKIQQFPLT